MNKKDEEYGGYTNFWTWSTYNWITGYENSYRYFEDLARNHSFEHFKEEVVGFIKLGQNGDVDLEEELEEALESINYEELQDKVAGEE